MRNSHRQRTPMGNMEDRQHSSMLSKTCPCSPPPPPRLSVLQFKPALSSQLSSWHPICYLTKMSHELSKTWRGIEIDNKNAKHEKYFPMTLFILCCCCFFFEGKNLFQICSVPFCYVTHAWRIHESCCVHVWQGGGRCARSKIWVYFSIDFEYFFFH